MRKVLLALALLGMVVGGASADENNLAEGVFIAHFCPELGYSSEAPALGWCGEYAELYAIDNCDDQINQIDVSGFLPASWFVLAAWAEPKVWCGTEFGLGDFNPDPFLFAEFNSCFPEDGLEIPFGDWPGPNTGIAFVVTGAPWTGNFTAVMHLGGYAYSYYGETVIPLDVDPPTGFAGTTNCETIPASFDAVCLGAMGINMPGEPCCPEPPEPWVCCDPETGDCRVLFEEECLAMGWNWRPDLGQSCDPNPCPPPPPPERACCFDTGDCTLMPEEQCITLGGIWHDEWDYCDPNPCPQPDVCCCEHDCYILLEEICLEMGCMWHPEFEDCEPENPCEIYTGSDKTSWGSIKDIYR